MHCQYFWEPALAGNTDVDPWDDEQIVWMALWRGGFGKRAPERHDQRSRTLFFRPRTPRHLLVKCRFEHFGPRRLNQTAYRERGSVVYSEMPVQYLGSEGTRTEYSTVQD